MRLPHADAGGGSSFEKQGVFSILNVVKTIHLVKHIAVYNKRAS